MTAEDLALLSGCHFVIMHRSKVFSIVLFALATWCLGVIYVLPNRTKIQRHMRLLPIPINSENNWKPVERRDLGHDRPVRRLKWASIGCDATKVNEDLKLTLSRYFNMIRDQKQYNFLFDCIHRRQTLQGPGFTRDTFGKMNNNSRTFHIPNLRPYHTAKQNLCRISTEAFKAFGIHIVPPCIPTPLMAGLDTRSLYPEYTKWLFKKSDAHGGKGQKIIKAGLLPSFPEVGVVQALIKPLLFDGRKVDIRLFALVASLDPPRIFLSQSGFTRIGSENEEKATNLGGLMKDYKVQQFATERGRASAGTLSNYMALIKSKGISPQAVWNRMQDKIAAEFLVSGQKYFGCKTNKVPYPCGTTSAKAVVDMIVDEWGEPYIMETGLGGFVKEYSGATEFQLKPNGKSHFESFDPIASLEARKAEWGIISMFMTPVSDTQSKTGFHIWLQNQREIMNKLHVSEKYTFLECLSLLEGMAAESLSACENGMVSILPRKWKEYDVKWKFHDSDKLLYEVHEAFLASRGPLSDQCVKLKF